MTTFTKTQIEAVMATVDTDLSVEAYAEANGFVVADAAPVVVTPRTKRPVGQTAVTILSSAYEGTALVSTNTRFANRPDSWIVDDWKKIADSSRKSDLRFVALANADDVRVYQSELINAVTEEDKVYLESATAQLIAAYTQKDYEFISKIKRSVQDIVQLLLDKAQAETLAEAANEAHSAPQHYAPVLGSTGLINNPYKYNAKSGKFTKKRVAKA